MIEFLFLSLMVLAAIGGGAILLKGVGLLHKFNQLERYAFSFVLGFGMIGWAAFFLALAGYIGTPALTALLIAFLPGVYFLRSGALAEITLPSLDVWGRILLAGVIIVLFFDILEGLSPPGDGDSLTYHFTLPKSFLSVGQLFPVYRAVEGTIPLLQHMTYMVALGTGGELTLTLWTMVSGWFASGVFFVIALRFMSFNYSLATTLLLITTPAVIYGAGSGQIEVRNAMFVLVAVLALSEALKTGLLRYALLAGIAAGFFVGSKYTGLIFAFACGLFLLPQKKWLSCGAVFSAALLLAGGQWYVWNWWITGDPVYPMLYGVIDYPVTTPWNDTMQAFFKYAHTEKAVPTNLLWAFLYPIAATLAPEHEFESLRVGFGPVTLLMVPLAGLGIWHFRQHVLRHPLAVFGGVCLIAYVLWFFLGPSQKIRHLLPIYPLLLLCLCASAARATQKLQNLARPMQMMMICVLFIQLAGASIFSLKFMHYVFTNETRAAFLKRNVFGYEVAETVNRMLTGDDHLMVLNRQFMYFFDVPALYANPANQAVIETHARVNNDAGLLKQLKQQKITHLLLPYRLGGEYPGDGFRKSINSLVTAGCLREVRGFTSETWESRTLPNYKREYMEYSLLSFSPSVCII